MKFFFSIVKVIESSSPNDPQQLVPKDKSTKQLTSNNDKVQVKEDCINGNSRDCRCSSLSSSSSHRRWPRRWWRWSWRRSALNNWLFRWSYVRKSFEETNAVSSLFACTISLPLFLCFRSRVSNCMLRYQLDRKYLFLLWFGSLRSKGFSNIIISERVETFSFNPIRPAIPR